MEFTLTIHAVLTEHVRGLHTVAGWALLLPVVIAGAAVRRDEPPMEKPTSMTADLPLMRPQDVDRH